MLKNSTLNQQFQVLAVTISNYIKEAQENSSRIVVHSYKRQLPNRTWVTKDLRTAIKERDKI